MRRRGLEMSSGSASRVAFAMSFSAFFVFPAFPIGESSGIAIPYILATVAALYCGRRLRAKDWIPFAVVYLPIAFSGAAVLALGAAPAPDVVVKIGIILMFSFIAAVSTNDLLG